MRQFILTILVISNIGAGFEIATDFDDARVEIGAVVLADGPQAGIAGHNDESAVEADCDHCCHSASHFAGAVVSCQTLPHMRASTGANLPDVLYQFVGRSPPTPPPNA